MRRVVHVVLLAAVVAAAAAPVALAGTPKAKQRPRGPGATFVVTRSDDVGETNPGNGVCSVSGGGCTLRAAIQESNVSPDANTIAFAVGFGGFTISPTSPLPTVDETTIIDGTTQPGFEGLPIVELNGAGAGTTAEGLRLQGNDMVVKGLIINRFARNGIIIPAASGNVLQGNFIGTDRTGTVDLGNGQAGINLGTLLHTVGGDIIGGPLHGPGNLISGNNGGGVVIGNLFGSNTIQGNLIGTDITGTLPLGNGGSGVSIGSATDNAVSLNVIADSASNGITVTGGSGNQILSNFVGTDATRTADLGNAGDGIELNNTNGNRLTSNRIEFNTGVGIDLNSGVDNDLANNDLSSNGLLGIDLGTTGVTPNDTDDPDSGANTLQNFPILSLGALTETTVTVTVSLNSTPSQAFDFHFYVDDACDPSGNGEGDAFGSRLNVSTNSGGDLTFTTTPFELGNNLSPGQVITATASRRVGDPVVRNTSELSPCFTVPFADTFVVNDPGDVSDTDIGNGSCATVLGVCTLRAAIQEANATSNWDRIRFGIGTGLRTISPSSALPPLATAMTVDATTQPGFAGDPLIELNGTNAGPETNGLQITGNFVTVKGLVINRFGGDGIEVAEPVEDAFILGSSIGTNAAGTLPSPNGENGIEAVGDATIGGPSPALRNVVSGNLRHGILVSGSESPNIIGNFIGTNRAGTAGLGNTRDGILVAGDGGAFIGSIGGSSSPALRNVIAANGANGVEALDGFLFLGGNFIGTTASGATSLGNARSGVRVSGPVRPVEIGTDGFGAGNVISGNQDGIALIGASLDPVIVRGNLIGTNAGGTLDRGNASSGIFVSNASNVLIGGVGPADRNVISGNDGNGVLVAGPAATGARLLGNVIGLNAGGTDPLPNGNDGVFVQAPGVVIGGTDLGARNVISGNAHAGVSLNTTAATGAALLRNLIGTDVTSGVDRGNGDDGVAVAGATGATIGGSEPGEGNVISGNDSDGVHIGGSGATGNVVAGNRIGTNGAGTADVGNLAAGVRLRGAPSNTVGGSEPADGNVIAGNDGDGVAITGGAASGNVVAGNTIGIRTAGVSTPVALPNGGDGILIAGAPGNTIGGDATSGNRIGGNGRHGVAVIGGGSGNRVAGNRIGTDGFRDLGNTLDGVAVSAPSTTIGGDASSRNSICGNGGNGVTISPGAAGTTVRGNFIGVSDSGSGDGCRNQNGVVVTGVTGIPIGGTEATDGNVIAGNAVDGVVVGPSAGGTVVQGNVIGLSSGGPGSANLRNGVRILQSNDVQVGGTAPGAGNVIRLNDADGVLVESGVRNRIRGNVFDENDEQGIDLGPDDGVTANDNQDPDGGANTLQNFPLLTSALTGGGFLTIAGSINSTPLTVFTLDVFASRECDPLGNGEGETFVGSVTLPQTNNQGNRSFNVDVPGVVPPDRVITLTATNPNGNTSEFSPCVTAVEALADLSVTVTDAPDPIARGNDLTYTVTVRNEGPDKSFGTTLTHTLGRRLDFVSADSSVGSCELTGTRVTCGLGTLVADATATITIVARTTAAGTITNTSTVAGSTTDPSPENNTASATTTVT